MMLFLFVFSFFPNIPMTFDMSKFYAPQAILGMLPLVEIAAYGFRYSVGGLSVFSVVLGETGSGRCDSSRQQIT